MNSSDAVFRAMVIISGSLHALVLFGNIEGVWTDAGQQGKEEMIVSLGTAELPADTDDAVKPSDIKEPPGCKEREYLDIEQIKEPEPEAPDIEVEKLIQEITPVENREEHTVGEIIPDIPEELINNCRWERPAANRTPGRPDPAAGRIEDIRTRFLTEVLSRVQKVKRYPSTARRNGIQGTSTVMACLLSDGNLGSVTLIETSGYPVLDREALRMFRKAAPFPVIPEELEAKQITLSVPVVFELEG